MSAIFVRPFFLLIQRAEHPLLMLTCALRGRFAGASASLKALISRFGKCRAEPQVGVTGAVAHCKSQMLPGAFKKGDR